MQALITGTSRSEQLMFPLDETIWLKLFSDGTIYIGPFDEENGGIAYTLIEGEVVDEKAFEWLRQRDMRNEQKT